MCVFIYFWWNTIQEIYLNLIQILESAIYYFTFYYRFFISYILYISSLIAWNEGIAIKSHNLYSMIKCIKG